MSDFVELPNGRLINTQAIRDFDPARSNRVNYLNGSYEQLAPEHGDVLKEALTIRKPSSIVASETIAEARRLDEEMKPKAPRGRKKKTDNTDK